MVPALFAPWVSQLVQRANPQPGDRVLDLACGTGVVARLAAPLLGSKGEVAGVVLTDDGRLCLNLWQVLWSRK